MGIHRREAQQCEKGWRKLNGHEMLGKLITGVRFVDDQPAGGRRLVTDAVGVEMSVVNGVVATRQGSSTGARPGRRLRPVAP